MFHSHWLLRSLPFHFVLGIVLNKTCCNQIALCFSLSSFIPICILQEFSAFFVRFYFRCNCILQKQRNCFSLLKFEANCVYQAFDFVCIMFSH